MEQGPLGMVSIMEKKFLALWELLGDNNHVLLILYIPSTPFS